MRDLNEIYDESLDNILRVRFPTDAGFMGKTELEAFQTWINTDGKGIRELVYMMSSDFVPHLAHLSHCISTIDYDRSPSVEAMFIFPSLLTYLTCVLVHFIPPTLYGDTILNEEEVEKINSALVLWQSGFVPLNNGVIWTLYNSSSVVSVSALPGPDLKLDA